MIAADKSQAVFRVSSVVDKTFNVSGTEDFPKIGGANALTLLSGSITAGNTAGNNQTLRNGENGEYSLIATNDIQVSYDKAASLGTVNGESQDKFSIVKGTVTTPVTVTGGNGIDFIIDSLGSVTISNFGDKDGTEDAFTYGNATYAIKGVGLVKTLSGSSYLWNDTTSSSPHKMPDAASIGMAALQEDSNWSNLQMVTSDTATISSTLDFGTAITFVDSDYTNTYGTLETVTGGYKLTKSTSDKLPFEKIYIDGDITSATPNVTLDNAFLNTEINAPNNTTVKAVTAINGGESGTYQVSLSSNNSNLLSFSGVSTAQLISGSMIADSLISVKVSVGNNKTTSVKSEGNDITLSAGADAAIAMAKDATFNANDYTYALGALGLSKEEDNKYLPQGDAGYTIDNEGGATIKLATITGNDYWAGIIAADSQGALSINSGIGSDDLLVVDKVDGPNYQYAKISKENNIYKVATVEGTNTSVWPDSNTFLVGNSSVSFASDFKNKLIAGQSSGAKFYFGGDIAAVVADGTNGATVTGSTNITLSSGKLFTNKTSPTITTPDGYSLKYGDVDTDFIGIIVGEDNAASISSLNSGDVFYICKDQTSNSYTMTSDRRLRTADNTKLYKDSVYSVLAVSDIINADKWDNIITVKGGILPANASNNESILTDSGVSAIFIDSAGDTTYGTITFVIVINCHRAKWKSRNFVLRF